mmetsp:Transcript_18031/g.45410  ORF Transcript_18031/g.45410 Transcript_18031/m.45410 type:complete len:99 (-) Transcript_18031:66-362(-)
MHLRATVWRPRSSGSWRARGLGRCVHGGDTEARSNAECSRWCRPDSPAQRGDGRSARCSGGGRAQEQGPAVQRCTGSRPAGARRQATHNQVQVEAAKC